MSEQQELAPKGSAKPPKKAAPWSEAQILAALRKRYAAPAFAFFPHVRNGTGFSRDVTRTADAIAMSLFPSRGLHLTGFEVKSDRHDWVRELRDPAKADEIAANCDFWILVVGDRDIVETGELPVNWGLMAPAGKKLKTFVEPKLLGERGAGIPRHFLAAVLRRAMEDSPAENAIAAAVAAAREEWDESRASRDSFQLEQAKCEAAQLRETIADFERESGVSINRWGYGRIGETLRALSHLPDPSDYAERLDGAAKDLADAAAKVRAVKLPPLAAPETKS